MVVEFGEDFSVVWQDPASASRTWNFDAVHFPKPLAPLMQDLLPSFMATALDCAAVTVNGYVFVREWAPPPPTQEILQRGVRSVWEDDYVPRLRAACERLRARDYDSMTAAELAEAVENILQEMAEAFRLTMLVVAANLGPTLELVAFCEQELGEEGPQMATSLLQGFRNESSAADAELMALAELALQHSKVAACLAEDRYDSIGAASGGGEFMSRFRSFLDEYGWRSEGFIHPEFATWAEEPDKALALIARYAADPASLPDRSPTKVATRREEARQSLESKLDPGKLARARALIAAAEAHVPVSEGRSYWQGTLMGSLRVPLMALGRKLVMAGNLQDANDVFYLRLADLKEAARDPGQSRNATVEHSKAELERWRRLTPPPFLGAPMDLTKAPPEVAAVLRHFFGAGEPDLKGDVLQGQAASTGVVRGRARIITDLAESARLQTGDILVCQTTSPPWTSLFSIAAGVVTDSGGILSHSAICAREAGIPCVVATQVATTRIRDGAFITVDGTHGTVTIESERHRETANV